jgi:succinate dehydrogenase flavin-adding protein (antitoxin of CptAB toxin-antitoxin module)
MPEQEYTALETRRKQLIYRSAYTGTKETDLILGGFARAYVGTFDDTQLDTYEALLDAGDPAIYRWATGQEDVPAEFDTDVFRLIKNFKVV